MTTRHRRAPSALPILGPEDLYESSSNGYSQPLPKFQLPAKETLIKQTFKPLNGKFLCNIPGTAYNDSSKFEKESNESSSSEKKIEICDEIDIIIDSEQDNPIDELNQAISTILKRREAKIAKVRSEKKVLKTKLFYSVKQELSDVDTDRRKDNNKYSEDTIEGPGSSFRVDDLNLVKFESSIEHVRRRKGKTVKFRD